jgi:formamidopyrimidine-DNA glycosylase
MPELPEVETIRIGLKEKIISKKIVNVRVSLEKLVKSDFKEFNEVIKGNSFLDIDRIGKLLIFRLKKGDKLLLVHLKMTGQLIYKKGKNLVAGGHKISETDLILPNKYSHIIFCFSDKSRLFFNDQRQFGYMKLVSPAELEEIAAGYGAEPFSKKFSLAEFKKIIKGRTANIKAILLDQKEIAGIGNIYADESLFAARIFPGRRAVSLTELEIKSLRKAIIQIMKKSVSQGGTTFSNFLDCDGGKGKFINFLKVYGRAGQPCLDCRTGIIKKIKIVGRGTSYCDKCQKYGIN